LERLRKEHDAAIQAIEAENKKKLEDKRGKAKAATPAAPPPKPEVEFRDGKPVFPGTTPAATKTPGLFDAQPMDTETAGSSSQCERG
jgi:hypothetical protein